MASSYIQYIDAKVMVIETGEIGEAIESFAGFITVYFKGENKDRTYNINEVKFL